METIFQMNHKTGDLELSDSIRSSMGIFFKNLPSNFTMYFTLTFKNIFRYHCNKCVNEFYKYGEPTKHWHDVSYGYVNNFAREFAEFFPKEYRLIIVEGATDYAKRNGVSAELQDYLKSGGKKGDSNYRNISSGQRPHIHGIVHGYDYAQFKQILHKSKYVRPYINLKPVKDCTCTCCTNWDNHEHIRTLEKQKYFDTDVNQYISEFQPVVKSTNTNISCHLYSPQPQGWYKPKLIEHDGDKIAVMKYLYKYLYKDLQKYKLQQLTPNITSYLHQESIDSKLKIY